MIYIDATKETQVVYVPRNGAAIPSGSELELKAVSTFDRGSVAFQVASQEIRGAFLRLVVGLPEGIVPGEWQYSLVADGEQLASGLMVVTEDSGAAIAYNQEIKYKQYGE